MHPSWPLDGPYLVDRAAHLRPSLDLSSAEVVVISDGSVLMDDGGVVLVPSTDRGNRLEAHFLGIVGGREIAAVGAASDAEWPSGRFVPLREALARLTLDSSREADRELAVLAVALVEWHQRHAFCPRCGARTEQRNAGWTRVCADGHEHHPRTDPAVIVSITDEADRLLLAHVSYHPPGRYSHLAGYVEPGESFEQAARREVGEEASLRIEDLDYAGSQPWPFPASIMVGYRAHAVSEGLSVDGVEVTDAFWATRRELLERLGSGQIRLASPGTMARTLIHEWFGGDPVSDAGVAGA